MPVVEGSDHNVTVRFRAFPVMACVDGHEHWEAYPDFNPEIINGLFHANRRIFTTARGIVRRRQYCSRCDTELSGIREIEQSMSVPIRSQKGHHFTLEITGPTVTCPTCGTVQIRDADAQGATIVEAMAKGLKKASIGR
jgi:hypothetical protein